VTATLLMAQGLDTVSGSVPRALPGNDYFSMVKLIVMVAALFAWAFPAAWTSRDARSLNLPHFLWGTTVMASAAVGWLLWFIVPIFPVGLAIWLVAAMGSILVYAFYRDSLVEEDDKVLSIGYLTGLLRGEKKQRAFQLEQKILLSTPTGFEVKVPESQEEQRIYQMFQDILFDSLWRRASDIYIQPAGQAMRVALRIDGVLNQYQKLDRSVGSDLITYVKRLANMDPQQKRLPQKGKLTAKQLDSGQQVELDFATVGSTAGERLTVRIRAEEARFTINDLGLTDQQLKDIQAVLKTDGGVVLICGQGNCGMSTTLYSIGRSHDAFTKNIHTLETNPLMDLDNITQNIYQKSEGGTFARHLQTIFRRVPDIVLIDPCPDPETACLTAQVVSKNNKKAYMTLRASTALSGLSRYIKWVEDPKLAAQTLQAVLFQRLVRKLCPACKEAYRPNPETLRKINLSAKKEVVFYRPPTQQQVDKKGNPIICPTCQGTGYFGRTAIFETLIVDANLRKAMAAKSAVDLKAAARKSGMRYWQEVAIEKVTEGITSMQEIVRVSKENSRTT